jgi:hypothetical protein
MLFRKMQCPGSLFAALFPFLPCGWVAKGGEGDIGNKLKTSQRRGKVEEQGKEKGRGRKGDPELPFAQADLIIFFNQQILPHYFKIQLSPNLDLEIFLCNGTISTHSNHKE